MTGGARDLAPRHQTLRAAIEWSDNLLDAAEKTLFRRLAVFAGGFTFEAAEVVVNTGQDPEVDVFEGITTLVDRSLLRQSEADDEPRFTMLETVREYAIEQLGLAGQAGEMQRRHADYYLGLAEAAAPELQGANQMRAYGRLEREYGNIRAALRWSQQVSDEREPMNEEPQIDLLHRSSLSVPRSSIGLRLLNALHLFVTQRGHFQEARTWMETLLTQTTRDHDPTLWGRALSTAGSIAISQGDLAAAQRWLQEAITSARQTDDRLGLAYALTRLGDAALPLGQHQAARQYHTESVDLFRQLGDHWGLARALNDLGDVLFRQGDTGAAETALAESNALFQQLGDTWMRALTLSNWALVALAEDNTPLAETRLQEAVQIARASGNRWRLGYGLVVLGEVARAQGEIDRAEAYYTESLGIYRDLGHPGNIVVSTINLAYVKQHRGEYAAADALLRDSLALAQRQGNRRGMTECLAALIGVAQGQGQADRAAHLLGAVEAVREALGALASTVDRARYDEYANELRVALGDTAYQTAWATGRALTLDQAIEYALTKR